MSAPLSGSALICSESPLLSHSHPEHLSIVELSVVGLCSIRTNSLSACSNPSYPEVHFQSKRRADTKLFLEGVAAHFVCFWPFKSTTASAAAAAAPMPKAAPRATAPGALEPILCFTKMLYSNNTCSYLTIEVVALQGDIG
jgi:hypothetical protein